MQMNFHQVVDDLILIKSLGKGNFGEVFLTQKKGRPEYYATKKMERSVLDKPETKKRLQYEIDILSHLNHPNIVKFFCLKKTVNNWYIVTEFCNGGSILDNLKKYMAKFQRPFPEEIVQYLMRQIVSGINYLHFNKIIHRDLKLDNILVNFPSDYDKINLNMMKCVVKIIDFGFATKLNGPLTYTALGTPTNMDPAILENIKTGIPNAGYNEKADIWSLGTLCYEMVVGTRAFNGKSMEELFQKVKKGRYSLPSTLSKEIVDFINKMLQEDPKQRLTAKELLSHEFLVKSPSQFQRINVQNIQASLGPGGVINMKTNNNQPKINPNNNIYQLWSIFNQPIIYQGMSQPNQVQPVMQLPQQYTYVQPQQQYQQYYINQQPQINQIGTGQYY